MKKAKIGNMELKINSQRTNEISDADFNVIIADSELQNTINRINHAGQK